MKSGMKQTVIGEIPADWKINTIGAIASFQKGKKVDTSKEFSSGCTPVIGASGFGGKYDTFTFSELGIYCSQDDILMLWDGERSGLCSTGHNGIIGSTVSKITPKAGVESKYLFYYLQKNFEWIQRNRTGSGIPHVPSSLPSMLIVALPPLPEQQKIAEILSTVDEKMAVIDEQLAQTQELKKGLMQSLLTKGIGHTTFKDSPLGEIPESWAVAPLTTMCKRICVGFVGTCEKFYVDKSEGVLMVRTGNLSDGKVILNNPKYVSHEFHEKNKKSQLLPGDLLIARHGSSGQAVIVPDGFPAANSLNIVIVRHGESLNPLFLHYQFNSDLVKNQITKKTAGSTQGVINTKEIASTLVAIPSLPEQRQIAEIFTTLDDKLQVLTDKKTQYQELKRGLMQQLLTGQRRVRVAAELATMA